MSVFPNELIAQFSMPDQDALVKSARFIELKPGDVLLPKHADQPLVYFLTSGSVALFVTYKQGQSNAGLAVGLVGNEAALGLQAALGMGVGNLTLIVQSHGYAYMLEAEQLRLLVKRHPYWLMIFTKSLWTIYQEIARLAAFSHVMDVRKRLADWLLISQRKCGTQPLFMTHEHIANMLGVRRASITIAAREMKLKGWLDYSRGHIVIQNLEALHTLAAA